MSLFYRWRFYCARTLCFLIVISYAYVADCQYRGRGIFIGWDNTISPNANQDIKLAQKVNSSSFSEVTAIEYASYNSVKVVYNPWVRINEGELFDWLGIEAGFGLSGGQSKIISARGDSLSAQLFDYYQMGNLLTLSDVGLSLHADVGTLIFAGVDVDAGFLFLKATSSTSIQEVSGWGGYFSPKFRFGMCIPIVGGRTGKDTKVYFKVYSQLNTSNLRIKGIDWIAPTRELKDFTTLTASNLVSIPGLALSIVFGE